MNYKKSLIKTAITTFLVVTILVFGGVLTYLKLTEKEIPPQKEPGLIVCLGDSITYGFGLSDRENQAWPFLLDNALEDYDVINMGFPGLSAYALSMFLENIGYLQQAIEQQGDIYFLMLGTNDASMPDFTAERYAECIDNIIERILSETNSELIILTPTSMFTDAPLSFATETAAERLENDVIPHLYSVSDDYGLMLIDLYELSKDNGNMFRDGVHPNGQFNEMIADEILKKAFSH